MRNTFFSYVQLAKIRIVMMVLVTTAMGYYFATQRWGGEISLLITLLGTGLATAGSGALNNYLERDTDALMHRTRERVLPQRRLSAGHALSFGVCLVLSGVVFLACAMNLLSSFLVLLASFLYVLVYTPMKRLTWLNTSMGAVPGAIPPLVGWAAACGDLGLGAWVLFFILFAWQHPHFYAIAWMYREDYARGGFKMLPVIETQGLRTRRHVVGYTLFLIIVSVVPFLYGLSSRFYLLGVLLLGFMFLVPAVRFFQSRSHQDARRVLYASFLYLPIFLGLIIAEMVL